MKSWKKTSRLILKQTLREILKANSRLNCRSRLKDLDRVAWKSESLEKKSEAPLEWRILEFIWFIPFEWSPLIIFSLFKQKKSGQTVSEQFKWIEFSIKL